MSPAQMAQVLGGQGQNYKCIGENSCGFQCYNTGPNSSMDSSDPDTYMVCKYEPPGKCHNTEQFFCTFYDYTQQGCPQGQGLPRDYYPWHCT